MICEKCGKEIDDEAIFCPECGERVSSNETKYENYEQNKESQMEKSSLSNVDSLSSPKINQGRKSSKREAQSFAVICAKRIAITFWAIAVIFAVVMIAGYVYPYSFDKTELRNGGYYASRRYKKTSQEIERRYYNAAGKSCTDDYGWHKYTWEYNSEGNVSKTYCYGMGKDYELYVVHEDIAGWNWSRHDAYGNLKENPYGIAKISGYSSDISLFGSDGKPVACGEGWARRVKDGNGGISYYGPDGNLTNGSEGLAERVIDKNRISYYGANGKRVVWSTNNRFSGWAVCDLKDDGVYLYDANMRPVNCKAGWQSLTKEKEGKGKIAIFFCDKMGNSVSGDPDASTRNLGEKDCYAFSIYVNHDDRPEGYTVWYDKDGKFLKGDESANEYRERENREEVGSRVGSIIPIGLHYSSIDDDFYLNYIDAMFLMLSGTRNYSHTDDKFFAPCVAYPK